MTNSNPISDPATPETPEAPATPEAPVIPEAPIEPTKTFGDKLGEARGAFDDARASLSTIDAGATAARENVSNAEGQLRAAQNAEATVTANRADAVTSVRDSSVALRGLLREYESSLGG